MSDMDRELIQEFVVESREHLEDVERDLLDIDIEQSDQETINRIFRAVHSVKGAAGFFGFEKVNRLAHIMENVLMKVRDGELSFTGDMIDALLAGNDVLRAMIEDLDHSEETDIDGVVSRVSSFLDPNAVPAPVPTAAPSKVDNEPATEDSQTEVAADTDGENKNLEAVQEPTFEDVGPVPAEEIERIVRLGRHLYVIENPFYWYGNTDRLLSTVEEWRKLGTVYYLKIKGPYPDSLEDSVEFEPTVKAWVESALEPSLAPEKYEVSPSRIKEVDLSRFKITPKANKEQPTADQSKPAAPKPTPKPPTQSNISGNEQKKASRPGQKKAPKATKAHHKSAKSSNETIRVKTNLLNRLMELAGELVLARNRLLRLLKNQHEEIEGLETVLHQLDSVTTEIQERIMQTRLQPIGVLFSKFPRVVRDLSGKLHKEVQLVTSGEEVELDKTIIENLSDILTHLVRNSLDHGIESPEERERKGKPRKGVVRLSAYHEAGMVNIDIQDDGKGIDPLIIGQKAVEKGIISQDELESKNDRELLNLIFMPGFSTAEQISDVSGRGVGMDVVKTNIEKLGGSIELSSTPGKGTLFNLKLPLTLAIIPSLIVEVNGHTFAVPQVALEEAIRVVEGDPKLKIETIRNQQVLRHRGTLLPLMRLSDVLGLQRTFIHPVTGEELPDRRHNLHDARNAGDKEEKRGTKRVSRILVLRSGRYRYGLLVDHILDNEEIVVKPLSSFVKNTPCFSGATILGDGTISVILDPGGLVQQSGLKLQELVEEVEQQKEAARARDLEERQSLLLFSNGTEETFAMPLPLIARVEKVPQEKLDKVGDKEYYTTDDRFLPLLRLDRYLNVQMPMEDQEYVYIIIPKTLRYPMGIVCHSIIDVVETTMHVDKETLQEEGIMGSMVLNEKIVLLLDIYKLVSMAAPEHYSYEASMEMRLDEPARVLLVEDTPFFSHLQQRYLEEAGFSVVTAGDGEEALEILKTDSSFDLIVSDIIMPRMDGLELAKRVKEDPELSSIPMVAVTSLDSAAIMEKATGAGFDAFAQKLDKERLLELLFNVLESSRSGSGEVL